MIYSEVKHLYIYKPPNEFTKKLFQDMRLWSAKPETFNDPFDCDLEVSKGITEEVVLQAVLRRYGKREHWPLEIAKFINSMFGADGKFTPSERDRIAQETQNFIDGNKNSGIICLSAVDDSIIK